VFTVREPEAWPGVDGRARLEALALLAPAALGSAVRAM